MNFYDRYVRLCMSVGKTPSKVAREVGLSKSTVTRWKDGGGITDPTAIKLADYFGIPLSELKGTNTIDLDGILYETAKLNDLPAAMAALEENSEQKEKPADQKASGLRGTGYELLTPEEKQVVDNLIEQLLALRSRE